MGSASIVAEGAQMLGGGCLRGRSLQKFVFTGSDILKAIQRRSSAERIGRGSWKRRRNGSEGFP